MPGFWVKFLPKLAKYDDLIQIDNIAHHWCLKYYHNMRIFDVEHWSYQTRQKGGMSWYCSFSLGFQCETVFSLIFSGNIHINCLGKLKKLLIFKQRGRFLHTQKTNVDIFLGKLGIMVQNEKMVLNPVFTIQMGIKGQYT